MVRSLSDMDWAKKRLRWASNKKIGSDEWRIRLYCSVDGRELVECTRASSSYSWINDPYVTIPAGDWIKYIHVRINALLSRIRTARGRSNLRASGTYRAGCRLLETTPHIRRGVRGLIERE